MVLENVKELWTEVPKTGKGVKKARTVSKDRFLSKMFIRGDSVILVLRKSEVMVYQIIRPVQREHEGLSILFAYELIN